MMLRDEAGQILTVGMPRDPGNVREGAQMIALIARRDFPMCPICFTQDPKSDEHVPQGTLGGRRMTVTCVRCNNVLGSRLEGHLLDWFDRAITLRVSADHIQGKRRAGRYLHREAEDGRFILLDESGRRDPALGTMAQSGKITIHYQQPTMRLIRLAAMKHAYLAACLWIGGIPGSDDADQIRRALADVRDQGNGKKVVVPDCVPADRLLVARTESSVLPPGRLALMRSTGTRWSYLISLAGSLVVSWPFSDFPPMTPIRSVDVSQLAVRPWETLIPRLNLSADARLAADDDQADAIEA